MSGAPDRLTDRVGTGSTFREIKWLAISIVWSLKSTASFILKQKQMKKELGRGKRKPEKEPQKLKF